MTHDPSKQSTMSARICVCGLGYVGAVTSACLAHLGHVVTGVDVVPAKVDSMNAGLAHFVEAALDDLTLNMVRAGRLSATVDCARAVRQADMTFICVGTPSGEDGALAIDHVRAVCQEIGEALRGVSSYHVVVIRSTLLPGVTRGELVPILERASGRRVGQFGVCLNPEFVREATAVADFFEPSRTVIGSIDERGARLLARVYNGLPGPVVHTTIEVAELVKYADNWWHALKVVFANEVGTLAASVGVDGAEAMRIFALDTKLNLSAKYLRPGSAFGGSCLPKDVRALSHMAREHRLKLPLLESVIPSNRMHIERALEAIHACGLRRVGVLGLAFKPGTDDIRESPALDLVAALIAAGYDVRVHDDQVDPARLIGANRAFLYQRIPDLTARWAATPEELCAAVDTVVLMHDVPAYRSVLAVCERRLAVVDCTRLKYPGPALRQRIAVGLDAQAQF